MGWLSWAGRGLDGLERLAILGASLCILATEVVVAPDVVMRYGFHAPLGWIYDLVSKYLMVGAFFLAVSEIFRRRAVGRQPLPQHDAAWRAALGRRRERSGGAAGAAGLDGDRLALHRLGPGAGSIAGVIAWPNTRTQWLNKDSAKGGRPE